MTQDDTWFTEEAREAGTAFSLKLGEKLETVQTPFQTIEIYRTETFGHLMVIDGCTMVSSRDNFLYHEMMAHPALFSHPDPRDVLIIGGGDCGTLREVLKHVQVRRAVQVDIDQQVTRLSEKYFPELCQSNDDPRAELVFGDGIQWIKDAAPESLDLVIVDSTDPVGPAEGLFGKPFYGDALRALRPGGLLVQQSESPLLHLFLILEMHKAMREAGFAGTHLLQFPQPIYPSGWWSATIASKSGAPLAQRAGADAAATLGTRYYTAEIHRGCFAQPAFVHEALNGLAAQLEAST